MKEEEEGFDALVDVVVGVLDWRRKEMLGGRLSSEDGRSIPSP